MIALPLSDYLMQRAATWVPTVLRVAKAAAVGAFAYLTAKISTLWNKVFSPETHQRKLARESRLAEIRRQGPKHGVAPQQAACTPSISQGAMPSGPDGKAPDKEPRKKEHMEGEDGTQTTSKTVYNRNGFRIDVENPNPGQRP